MRILVLETNRSIAGFIEAGLRDERYEVDVAETTDRAAGFIAHWDYDVVILDMNGIGGDVAQVADRLWHGRPTPPLLILTTPDGERAAGSGPHLLTYLNKPFRFDNLLTRLDQLLIAPRPSEPTPH